MVKKYIQTAQKPSAFCQLCVLIICANVSACVERHFKVLPFLGEIAAYREARYMHDPSPFSQKTKTVQTFKVSSSNKPFFKVFDWFAYMLIMNTECFAQIYPRYCFFYRRYIDHKVAVDEPSIYNSGNAAAIRNNIPLMTIIMNKMSMRCVIAAKCQQPRIYLFKNITL